MDRMKRATILSSLIESLWEKGSWCGETHVQKSTYFLQEMLRAALAFDFILYKHGPFSFDLSDELVAMQADEIIQLKLRPHPYGPSMRPGPKIDLLKRLFPKTLGEYRDRIEFISAELGGYGVADLERIATAFYVTRKTGNGADKIEKRASDIHLLKPHISVQQARTALEREREISEKAEKLLGSGQ